MMLLLVVASRWG